MQLITVVISVTVILLAFLSFKTAFGLPSIRQYLPHTHLLLVMIIIETIVGMQLQYLGFRTDVSNNFGLADDEYLEALFWIWYTIIMFSAVLALVSNTYRLRSKLNAYLIQGIIVDNKRGKVVFSVLTILGIFIVIYLYYYNAPIFALLNGNLENILISRVDYGRNFGGSYFIKNILGQYIVIMTSYVIYIYAVETKERFWVVVFLINFVTSAIIASASMSKSGLVNYLIPYLFIESLRGHVFKIRSIIRLTVVATLILIVFYAIQTHATFTLESIMRILRQIADRVLLVQIQSFPAFLSIFPRLHPFTNGAGIALLRFLGFNHIESARVVASFLEPGGYAQGWIGVSNTIFQGDAYANFGVLGLLFAPILVAFWIAFIYYRLLSTEKNPINLSTYVFILNGLINGFMGGFCSAFIVNTLVITAIAYRWLLNALITDFDRRKIMSHHPYSSSRRT